MKKVRLGLCIGDNEYSLRFTNCIMNHYQEQVELHIYSENAELLLKAIQNRHPAL